MATNPRKPRPHGEFLSVAITGRMPSEADREAWLTAAYRHFVRVLRSKYPVLTADSIAEAEVERAVVRFEQLCQTWTPKRYVRERVNGGRALLDWQRSERVQRGEGARGNRHYVGLDAPLPVKADGRQRTAADLLVDATALAVDEQITTGLIHTILAALSERDALIVVLKAVEGWQITEIAEHVGLSRERTSRIYHAAIRRLRDEFGGQVAEYFGDTPQPPC